MREISKSNNLVLSVSDLTRRFPARQVLVFRKSIGMPENAQLDDLIPELNQTWREIALDYVISTRWHGDRVLQYSIPTQYEILRAKARRARLREKRERRKKPPLRGLDPAERLLSRKRGGGSEK